jgi:hypothetical protein
MKRLMRALGPALAMPVLGRMMFALLAAGFLAAALPDLAWAQTAGSLAPARSNDARGIDSRTIDSRTIDSRTIDSRTIDSRTIESWDPDSRDVGVLGLLDLTWPEAALPASAILSEVRREGFHPMSRPFRRGNTYVLLAVDQDDLKVKLTADAATGRVLWVTGAVAHFGGPDSRGYRSIWQGQPPVSEPGSARSGTGPAAARHVAKRLPLPRARPANLPSSEPVTMVPVAPLE